MANRWTSFYGKSTIIEVVEQKMEKTIGIALVRMENGKEVYQPKITYLRMKNAGRNVILIAEASTKEELDKKLRHLARSNTERLKK